MTSTSTTQSAPVRRTQGKLAAGGLAAVSGVAVLGAMLAGGLTGASWSDKVSPGEALYTSTGAVELTAAADVSWVADLDPAAGQATAGNTLSPYPGADLRRVWSGTATAVDAGTVALQFGGATFDIVDDNGNTVGTGDWDARFDTQVVVELDGVTYADEDPETPGIQFTLPHDVTNAPLVVTIDGTYPSDVGNETQGTTVRIAAGDIDLYQVGLD